MELKYCKHRIIEIDRDGHVKSRRCNEVADQIHSWCKKHRQAQTILDVGKLAGFPRIVTKDDEGQEQELVGAGFREWEEYSIYSLCEVPIMKNHRQVIAPTGLQKITPYLNTLIAQNSLSEGQQQGYRHNDVALSVPASKPSRIDSKSDLAGVFGDVWELPTKKTFPAPAPGKVAVLDREEEDIDFDPEEVFSF